MKKKILLLSFVIFFIFSCTQQALKQQDGSDSLLPPLDRQSMLDASTLLSMAEDTKTPQKNKLLIQVSYIFIKNKAFEQAEEALVKVKNENLKTDLSAFLYTQQAEILLNQQQATQAINLLDSQINLSELSLEAQILVSETKSRAFFQDSQYIKSISELIFISPLLDHQYTQTNNELIWQTLSLLPKNSIESSLKNEHDYNLLGWLELAHINKAYQHDIEVQSRKLDEWSEKYKNHDANNSLPETLKQIKLALKNRPKKIAIFLPESGPFAKSADAIKRGFLNNYYRALEEGSFAPELFFYNTSDENLESVYLSSAEKQKSDTLKEKIIDTSNSIEQINSTENNNKKAILSHKEKGFLISYQNAIANGAELIIGPINKNYIDLLQKEKKSSTPTLTLNYSTLQSDSNKTNIYQFGLAPEDEIEFIGKQAWLKEYRNVAILTPSGEWGGRLSQSFKQTWEKKGGAVVTINTYENTRELTKIIEEMLNINLSEGRFKRLYWYNNGKVSFYSRRREDVDFIYLVATPEMGRQIIPTFAFHNASNIPVYSNSNIYSGEYNASDKDLSGLMFSDLPSIINNDANQTAWRNQDVRYKRLIAMGMDTYDLSVRLNILRSSPQNKMNGQTGILDISENLRINREPTLAKFYGGNVKAIPILFDNK